MWFIIRNYLIDNYAFGIEGYEVCDSYSNKDKAEVECKLLNATKEHGEHYFVNEFNSWQEAEEWCNL